MGMVESRLQQREDGDSKEIKEMEVGTERQLGFQRVWLGRGVAAMRLLGRGRDIRLVINGGCWSSATLLLGRGRDIRLVINGGCWSLATVLQCFEQPQLQPWLLR